MTLDYDNGKLFSNRLCTMF